MSYTLNKFLNHIQQYISAHQLLQKTELYLVALSGGADSVCLLRSLLSLGYQIEAVHCNFKLRGSESDHDEKFCQTLCQRLGIKLHLVHFDTKEYAKLHRVSIEMAARDLRYSYFEQLRKDIHAAGICVGHHIDDSVETVLMNLIRSTGINGLTGIAPKNGFILRPLLSVTHCEINNYLRFIQQDYVTDSSNLVADVQRNKIRLDVIPLLETINPAAKLNIAKTANRLSDLADVLEENVKEQLQWQLTAEGFLAFPLENITHEYYLWYLLRDYHFTAAQIEQIFEHKNAGSGRTWMSDTHEILLDRSQLLLAEKDEYRPSRLGIPEPGTYQYTPKLKFKLTVEPYTDKSFITNDKTIAFLDADKVSFPLTFRPVIEGDKFVPFGMKGSKLLSDFMTDHKMSLFEKRRQLVVTDSEKNIIWVVNCRPDNRFSVSSQTRLILKIATLPES